MPIVYLYDGAVSSDGTIVVIGDTRTNAYNSTFTLTSNGNEIKEQLEKKGIKATFVGKVITKKGAYILEKQIFAEADELYRKMGE